MNSAFFYQAAINSIKKIIIVLFIFLMPVISGCDLNFGNNEPSDRGADILQARECGQEGLQCCNENPPCSYGMQCCSDPNNPGINQCANDCACGIEDGFCCQDGPPCQAGFSCYQGLCRKCGGEKQPCCGGESPCQEKLGCQNSLCLVCGANNNPCCPDEKCDNQDKLDKERAECISNICQPCGSYGLMACAGEMKCLAGNLYNNNLCYKCGGQNQPCCNEAAGLGFQCDPKQGLSCIVGFCNK